MPRARPGCAETRATIRRRAGAGLVARLVARLAARLASLPLAALLLGALLPGVGDWARPHLAPLVAALVFCCVAAAEPGPPTRREMGAALTMLAGTAGGAAAALAGIALLRPPPDLAPVAAMLAGCPVAVGAGALCRSRGMAERPAVWASLAGIALAPLLLPLLASAALAASGAPDAAAPATAGAIAAVAGRALFCGLLPAAAAVALRRAAPAAVHGSATELRAAGVLCGAGIGLAAGATASRALRAAGGDAALLAAALPLSLPVLLVALLVLVAVGRAGAALRPLCFAALLRNVSLSWTAADGALSARADALLATAVVLSYLAPVLLLRATRPGDATGNGPTTLPAPRGRVP